MYTTAEDFYMSIITNFEKKPQVGLELDDIIYVRHFCRRELWFAAEVNAYNVSSLIQDIMQINYDDEMADIPPEKRRPIIMHITSVGGSVVDGMHLIDAMNLSKTPIYTVVEGYAYSMACEIAVHGHKRYATKNSTFLIHDGEMALGDSMAKLNDAVEFNNICRKERKNLILSRTKIPKTKLQQMDRVEWYMFAKDALKYGLIDEIIEPGSGFMFSMPLQHVETK